MDTEKILRLLCASPGVSGFESEAANTFLSIISPFADECRIKTDGTVLAFKHSKKDGAKKLLIEAHSDEVGLMITKVCEGGFLKFAPIGGIDPKILPSSRVTVYGKEKITGVIGAKPPHLQTKGEDKRLKISDMAIDTGLDDVKDEVKVGDIAVFDSPVLPLLGNMVSARCLDNRACLAALCLTAEMIKESPYEICFAAASGEETGLRGAYCLSRDFNPDISITLDVTFGEGYKSKEDSFPLGAPALCISPSLDRALFGSLSLAAKEEGIEISYEVCEGSSGTNAWAVSLSAPDSRAALLSVPIRYMHSVTEVCCLTDIYNSAKIVSHFASKGGI